MKFSLSNLLFLVTVLAVAIGWWCDHRRLEDANTRLNVEATELFSDLFLARYSSGFPTAGPPGQSFYSYSNPDDRKQLLKLARQSQAPMP